MADLSALPPELVCNIFAFVRKNDDRKQCCLANRMFRDLMLPILWRILRTDLCRDEESFETLVRPDSNIIPHVKSFKLRRHDDTRTLTEMQRQRLTVLLAALPRDGLRRFLSSVALDNNAVRVLVQSQKLLQDFDAPLCEALSERVDWSHYLPTVEYVTCLVKGDAIKAATALQNRWPLLQHTPKMAYLTIRFDFDPESWNEGYADISLVQWPEVNGEAPKYVLTLLKLIHLDLGSQYTRISDYVDFGSLTKLNLRECWECQPMLEALTRVYATGKCVLQDLSIYLPEDAHEGTKTFCRTIEELLLSFDGLSALFLNMGPSGLVSKESVMKHSRTLTCLAIGTCQSRPIAYEASDLTSILRSCIGITQLGVSIGIGNTPVFSTPWKCLCHDILDIDGPRADRTQINKIRDILIAIAQHSRIHSFRFMDPAFLDWNKDNTAYQWTTVYIPEDYLEIAAFALQDLATHILQVLYDNGSKVRALAWIPTHLSTSSKRPVDSNGHSWPDYAYFKGQVVDAHGVQKVVAIPTNNIHREMIESSIFLMG